MRGFFLTLEGIDGSGKSSLAGALAEWLEGQGYQVVRTKEPGGTPLGRRIRDLLLDNGRSLAAATELYLYLADRAEHVEEILIPALEAGKVVISERYTDSTVAYQGYGRGVDLALLAGMNEFATQGLVPDLTLLLEVPLEVGRERRRALTPDRVEAEPPDFHARVLRGYAAIASQEPERVKRIDASRDPGAVLEEAKPILAAALAGRGFGVRTRR